MKRELSMKSISLFVLILLIFPLAAELEITRNNSYDIIPDIEPELFRLYAYEYTVYQISLQLAPQVKEIIRREPRKVRRIINAEEVELVCLIPELLDFTVTNETLTKTHLNLTLKTTLDEERIVNKLLTITPERRERVINYREKQASEMRLINLVIRDLSREEVLSTDAIVTELYEQIRRLNVNHWVHKGDISFITEDYPEAIQYYNNALEIDPSRSELFHKKYRTYAGQGDKDKAIESLEALLALQPYNVEVLALLGDIWRDEGKAEKAVIYYERLLNLGFEYPELAYYLARYYREIGSDSTASNYAVKAANWLSEPSDIDSHLAALLLEYNLMQEVQPLLQRLLIAEPRNAALYQLLGDIAYNDSNFARARIFYEQSVKLKPNSFKTLLHLGNCNYNLEDYYAASEYYTRAIAIDDSDSISLYNLGNALFNLGRYRDAADYYHRAIMLGLLTPEIFFNIGNANFMQGQYEQSIDYFQAAIEEKPDYIAAMFNLGNAYEHVEERDKALLQYNRIIELDPDFYQAYYNIANYCKLEGKLETAIEYYLKTTEINDEDDYSYSNMADCYRMLGFFEEAEEAYLRAIELNPDNPIPYNNLSLTYYLQENYIDSLQYLRIAARLGHYNARNILREFRND